MEDNDIEIVMKKSGPNILANVQQGEFVHFTEYLPANMIPRTTIDAIKLLAKSDDIRVLMKDAYMKNFTVYLNNRPVPDQTLKQGLFKATSEGLIDETELRSLAGLSSKQVSQAPGMIPSPMETESNDMQWMNYIYKRVAEISSSLPHVANVTIGVTKDPKVNAKWEDIKRDLGKITSYINSL